MKSRFFAVGMIACVGLLSFRARADDKATCVTASTQGQVYRDEGKLNEAKEEFVTCAREQCPVIVRRSCAQWLSEVEHRVPTITMRAVDDAGRDLVDVRVSVDGKAFVSKLDGKAVALNPGEHQFRFERDGTAPVEQTVVVVEGEKGRLLTARFPGPAQGPTASGIGGTKRVVPPPPGPSSSTTSAPIPISVWIAGGVGVVGVAGFAYFGLSASSDVDHLRSTCAGSCKESDVNDVRTKMLFADISLGVGVVGFATATIIYFTSRSSSSAASTSQANFAVRPIQGGGLAEFGTRF